MSLENAMVLDVQDADIYDYNYQYDGNANPAYLVLSAGDKAANVFEVKQPWQRLEAVGFTT